MAAEVDSKLLFGAALELEASTDREEIDGFWFELEGKLFKVDVDSDLKPDAERDKEGDSIAEEAWTELVVWGLIIGVIVSLAVDPVLAKETFPAVDDAGSWRAAATQGGAAGCSSDGGGGGLSAVSVAVAAVGYKTDVTFDQ